MNQTTILFLPMLFGIILAAVAILALQRKNKTLEQDNWRLIKEKNDLQAELEQLKAGRKPETGTPADGNPE